MKADRAEKADPSYADVLSTNAGMWLLPSGHDGDFSILWYNFGPADTSVSTLNEEAEAISKFWFEAGPA